MDWDNVSLGWIIFGLILMTGELLLPGLVVLFPGIAAITVGFLFAFGVIGSFSTGLTFWFILSIVYIVTLRWIFLRVFPSDSRKERIMEDNDLSGKEVPVTMTITGDVPGRIRYRDTTWQAISDGDTIEPGSKVILVSLSNNIWTVKKITKSQEP